MSRSFITSVLGSLVGLIIALVWVAAMPHHYVATVSVALPAGVRVSAPAGAELTPSAQLYGALGPARAPAILAFTGTAGTAARAVAVVLAQQRRWQSQVAPSLQIPPASTTLVTERSSRLARDALLGLIAGLLAALALTTVGRDPRARAA